MCKAWKNTGFVPLHTKIENIGAMWIPSSIHIYIYMYYIYMYIYIYSWMDMEQTWKSWYGSIYNPWPLFLKIRMDGYRQTDTKIRWQNLPKKAHILRIFRDLTPKRTCLPQPRLANPFGTAKLQTTGRLNSSAPCKVCFCCAVCWHLLGMEWLFGSVLFNILGTHAKRSGWNIVTLLESRLAEHVWNTWFRYYRYWRNIFACICLLNISKHLEPYSGCNDSDGRYIQLYGLLAHTWCLVGEDKSARI